MTRDAQRLKLGSVGDGKISSCCTGSKPLVRESQDRKLERFFTKQAANVFARRMAEANRPCILETLREDGAIKH
jgi:hypothetical protein